MHKFMSCLTLTPLIVGCQPTTEPVEPGIGTVLATPAALASPVNGRIAYTRYDLATGDSHIFIANADGTGEHQLNLPYPADFAVWSPDGSKILITMFRPDAPIRPAVVNPDGAGLSVLDVAGAPGDAGMGCKAWSPDGSRLLCQVMSFSDDHTVDGIYTISASDGGGLLRLTDNPYPPVGNFGGGDIPGGYSPDGSQFVFMRAKPGAGPTPDRNQTGALYVENTDGTGLRQITPYGLANSHDDGVAHWSPNGRDILFASAVGSLFSVHVDGTGLRNIPLQTGGSSFFVRAPRWSPDGSRIVFSMFLRKTGRFDIYTANDDGNGLAPLTDTPEFENFAHWGAGSATTEQLVLSGDGSE
jgi:Tol biopolymer transport system component